MDARERRDDGGQPASDWMCRIRPLDVEIVVGCTTSLVSSVERLLSPWSPTTLPARGSANVCISGPWDGEPHGPFVLRDGTRLLAKTASAGDLLLTLQGWLDDEVRRRATHLTPVHAGVVAWCGRGVLLPGQSGSGKTTLVRALVEHGADYYSDELAFLDARGFVHAFPRHMVVRDEQGSRSMPAGGTLTAGPAIPVSLIIGLRFEATGLFRVDPIPSSEAILLLLANSPRQLTQAGGIPAALLQAAGAALSYRGIRGDPHRASEAVLQLAARNDR